MSFARCAARFSAALLLLLSTLPGITLHAQDLPVIGITKIKAPVDDSGLFYRVNTKAGSFEVMLETQLTQIGRFKVMERNRVDEVLGEQGLNNEFGDGATAGGGFNVSGVDYLVYGSIIKFGQTEKAISTGNFKSIQVMTEFSADIKVVDASTGEVKRAETAEVAIRTGSGMATGGFVNASSDADPLADAQRLAAKKVAAIIATSIFPMEVLKGGEVIYLNYGEAILNVGDQLKVFRQGEALIDEATGLNLGSEEEQIAMLEVTEVTDKFSKAKLVDGSTPSKGDHARVSSAASERAGSKGAPGQKRGRAI
jgi:hypothetical protein